MLNRRSATPFIFMLSLLLLGVPISIIHAHEPTPFIPPVQWFEPNQGQSDLQFAYIAHDRGYRVFLGRSEMAYSLIQSRPDDNPEHRGRMTFVNVHMQLMGANASLTITGEEPLPGVSNYVNSNGTIANIPHYGGVRYSNLYDGIDMLYRSSQGELQYDFQVAPGADPRQIRLHFTEVERLEIAANGDLLIHAANQNLLTHKAPYSYQTANGLRLEVRTRYVLFDDHTVGFEVEDYDISQALVIDPPVIYSTYIGGAAGGDTSIGISVDAAGNAYIAGQAQAPGFPTTPGALDGTYDGYTDAFVTKLSSDGSALIYSTYLGGTDGEYADSIAVDNMGNAYMTGGTQSTDFPLTPNAFQMDLTARIFVSKLNAAGNALLYSTRLGGTGGDESNDIAVDNGGNAYITGSTQSPDFPTRNVAQAYAGGGDAFVTRLNTNAAGAASLIYSTYVGGNGGALIANDIGRSIAVDTAGNAYITGETYSPDFPTTASAYDNTLGGSRDTFVVRLDTNAAGPASMIYSTLLGGAMGSFGPVFLGADISYGIAADNTGNAYITGHTYAPDFPVTVGAWDTTFNGPAGNYDSYVAKVNTNAAGTASLVYSTFLGGNSSDDSMSIALTSSGVYVVGYTLSGDFPTLDPSQPHTPGEDAFLTGLNADGSALTYSTYFGGSASEHGLAVAVDLTDNVYFTGFTQSGDFPTTNGALDAGLGGWMDGFVVKMGALSPTPTATFTPTTTPTATLTPTTTLMPTGTPTTIASPSPTSPATLTPSANTLSPGSGQTIAEAFDPSISKIGFWVSAQAGTNEQVEWIVTVWNATSVTGSQVVVTDTLKPELRIDHVEADKGVTTIVSQTVTVALSSLAPNEQATIHIFTTSAVGANIKNTACVSTGDWGGNRCATAQVVRTLPATGEAPWWRTVLIGFIAGIVMIVLTALGLRIYGR